jgi:hypothetical protein
MGWFDDQQIISVSSTAYNLAGDVSNQPTFLRTLVIQNMLSGSKTSMGDTIRNGYIGGLGIKMRSFFRWADINYTYLGMPNGGVYNGDAVPPSLVTPHIPPIAGSTINVTEATLESGYFDRWVEQWFLDNEPDLINDSDFTIGIDPASNLITITWTGGRVETFTPTDYIAGATYVVASYYEVKGPQFGPTIIGSPVTLSSGDSFPDVTGWTLMSTGSTTMPVTLTTTETVVKSYSDSRPDEVEEDETTSSSSFLVRTRQYQLDVDLGQDPSTTRTKLRTNRRTRYFFENGHVDDTTTIAETEEEIEPGVFMTTTTTTVVEYVVLDRSWREDTQLIIREEWSGRLLYLYRIGTGIPALDSLVSVVEDYGKFFPVIPLRLNNTNVTPSNNPTLYDQSRRAMKKALGGDSYADILATIAEHPNVGDIDYAYVVFGVALNTTNKSSRLYLYDFFKKFLSSSGGVANTLRVSNNTISMNYDIQISWTSISEGFGSGLGRPGAKFGDVWVLASGATTYIYKQYAVNAFSYIVVNNLVHNNYIYQGNRVTITAAEAMSTSTESGFIIPLHNGTFREMSLVHSTQMANSCCYIVINAYAIQTIPWWQTGFWGWIFVIVIAIGSVVFTGGAGLGLLGAHLAVGGALGLTGITAAIVGAVANAVAALVLVSIISSVSNALFGETLGPIISAIVSIVVMNVAANFHATGTFGFNITDLFRAENLLKLTNAGVDAYTALVQQDISGMQTQMQTLQEQADAELKRIRQAYGAEFGYGGGQIDPLGFVGNSPVMAESRDTFLTRTLLTGSDIAQLSFDMINDYTELTLTLPPAFS